MVCTSCGRVNRAGRKFCAGCGVSLALACPSCGTTNEVGELYCGGCGKPLAEPPESVAEKRLASPGPLESERKHVTVLFADVKESTALIANRDPEEAQKLLGPVVERMIEAVHHYEGTVSRVMGDGVMALFGAPRAQEEHAVRACYAALRMQESIRRYAEETRHSYGVEIQIRIGLHSGEVVVQSMENDLYLDYTAIGETAHLAARMEQLALPGTIRVTAQTFRLAEGYVAMKALGPVPVKGIPQPVEVYEALGPGPARTRMQATAAARSFARFVGRGVELQQLRRALEEASEGRGQIVAVVGEAGVGKSRLLYEFTHSQRAGGWLLLEASAVPYGTATSYLPVIDLLKAYFGIGDQDDHAAIQQKVTTKLVTLDPDLEAMLTPLLALLDVPVDGEWKHLDPPRRRQLTLDAVKRLFLRESQVQPLVLVVEDLHWVDAETQALVDALVDRLPAARLLLLLSQRPEYVHGGGNRPPYVQIRLDPLPPGTAGELLHALLGDDASIEPLTPLLMERAGGNPLFLEECVRSLIETGVLAGGRGAHHLARPLDSVQVPATLQAILASRIDRLPPVEKQLLQLAAVIGKDVPFNLLRAVSGGGEEALRSGLAHLQAAEFLYESSLFPDLEFTFKHSLTHDVAYRSMLQGRRRALHAAFVGTIEKLYPDRLPEHFERLAHHALGGELWEKAVHYFHRSARKAGARSAYREAAASYGQALTALANQPGGPRTFAQAIDLRFELNFMLMPLGEISRAIRLLSDAEPIAEALGDRPRLARLLSQKGYCLWAQGSYEGALDSGRRALDIAIALGHRGSQIDAGLVLGMIHYVLGDFHQAVDTLGNALRLLGEEPFSARFLTFYSVALRVGLALSFGRLGRLVEAADTADEALRIAEAVGDSHDLSTAYSALGFVCSQKGEFKTAIGILEHGLDICDRAALAVTRTVLAVDLGRSYAYSGRAEEGVRLIEETLLRAGGEIQVYAGDWQTSLGESYLRAGRVDEAARIAHDALALCRTRGQRGAEAECLHLLGDIACNHEPPDLEAAEARYSEAMAHADELGMRALVARCHLGLGQLERRAGESVGARQHLGAAASLFRELGIRFWLEQVDLGPRAIT